MLNQIKNWPTRMVGRGERIYSLDIRAVNAYRCCCHFWRFERENGKDEDRLWDMHWLLGAHCILGNCSGPSILLFSIIVDLEVFACLCQVSNDKISIILLLRHL